MQLAPLKPLLQVAVFPLQSCMVLSTSQESCPFQTAQRHVWGGFGCCCFFVWFFFTPQISDKIAQSVQLERAFSSFIFFDPEIMSVTDGWRIQ